MKSGKKFKKGMQSVIRRDKTVGNAWNTSTIFSTNTVFENLFVVYHYQSQKKSHLKTLNIILIILMIMYMCFVSICVCLDAHDYLFVHRGSEFHTYGTPSLNIFSIITIS